MPQSLYVHVPFCEQICHYCDFNKFFLKNQPIEEYLEMCEREILQTVEAFPPEEELSTIYIGGGTPTALTTTQLQHLLTSIKSYFPIHDKVEWTVEVNPGSADEEKLSMMHELGVNRLSIGAQTFDPHLLKAINRDHEPEDVAKTVALSKKAGINNLSIDMMFGLPGQSFDQWQESLEEVCQLPITHISAYSLKIEEKTVFYQLMRKGKLSLPGEEIEANMYEYMLDMLDRNGFNHYEISNFAKSSYYSNHNLTYWNNNEYYGIGAGAHSYVEGVRRANHGPLPKYMKAIKEKKLPYFEENHVSLKEQMEEQMFMGLRKLIGISFDTFKARFGKDLYEVFPEAVTDLINRGLLIETRTHLKLSKKGLLLGNEVFEQFLLND